MLTTNAGIQLLRTFSACLFFMLKLSLHSKKSFVYIKISNCDIKLRRVVAVMATVNKFVSATDFFTVAMTATTRHNVMSQLFFVTMEIILSYH